MEYFISSGIVEPGKCLNLDGIGVDLNEWAVVPISLEPVSFIMVARLLREKGVYEYIDAIRLLRPQYPNIRFYLVGSTDLNPGSVHATTIQEWVNSGFVECPGHVEVRPWIERSSVFVLPSYREGVPRSTQEAMAMGRPVITTDVPGCRETVIDNENGFLIPAGDAPALASAMQKFIENPTSIRKMGLRSRELAEVKFNALDKDAIIMGQLLHFRAAANTVESSGV
jgi:glycosyltransferase involved in cell wall biosynthesis